MIRPELAARFLADEPQPVDIFCHRAIFRPHQKLAELCLRVVGILRLRAALFAPDPQVLRIVGIGTVPRLDQPVPGIVRERRRRPAKRSRRHVPVHVVSDRMAARLRQPVVHVVDIAALRRARDIPRRIVLVALLPYQYILQRFYRPSGHSC